MAPSLNVLVIGTGMYVCGRGTPQSGTIMPALCQWNRTQPLGEVWVVGSDPEGARQARAKIEALQRQMGCHLTVRCQPEGARPDPAAYRKAVAAIPRPACAIVAVPDMLHRRIAGAALEGGLHTLVVKPLAPTVTEVQELIGLQQRTQRYGAVEFHKRLDRANLTLRDTIRNGTLGELLYALVQYSQRKSVPAERFRKWVEGTNCFQYLGVHYVDLLAFVTGALPLRAMAVGQRGWLSAQGIDTHDAIEALIEWELPSGRRFSSHLLTSWVDPECSSAMSDQRLTVVGTAGRFESDQKRRGIQVVSDGQGLAEPNPDFCAAFGPEGRMQYRGYGIDSIHQFLQDVMDLEAGRRQLEELEAERPTFQQALVSTAVVEAITASLRHQGEWVEMGQVVYRS